MLIFRNEPYSERPNNLLQHLKNKNKQDKNVKSSTEYLI